MKNIIFIAPPAAGKGTQAKKVSEKYNMPHISTGDLLRDEVASGSEFGQEIKEIMTSGKLVDDQIITKLLKNRLSKDDCLNGYILDGYPRNLSQAKIYDNLLKELNKDFGIALFLDIDKELAMERTLSRIVCPTCGTSYNLIVEELKPKKENICDKCSNKLNVRSDDNKETFMSRFDTYIENTQSLIDYYQSRDLLKIIKVTKGLSADEIFNQIEEILQND